MSETVILGGGEEKQAPPTTSTATSEETVRSAAIAEINAEQALKKVEEVSSQTELMEKNLEWIQQTVRENMSEALQTLEAVAAQLDDLIVRVGALEVFVVEEEEEEEELEEVVEEKMPPTIPEAKPNKKISWNYFAGKK